MEYSDVHSDFSCGKHDHNMCGKAGKMESYGERTLWLFNIAMENDPFIDGLPIKNGDFPWRC